jgi:prevent-host-death family protein
MKTAPVRDVKARFSAHLKDLEQGPLVITRKGRPVGVLLGVQDEDEIEWLILGYTPRLRPILEAADHWMRAARAGSNEGSPRQTDARNPSKRQQARARRKNPGRRHT